MVRYSSTIVKKAKRGIPPKQIFIHFDNALKSIDMTKDLTLFDIKKLKTSETNDRNYYRLRKGKYRAIFYVENENVFVIDIDKREDVYKQWE
jgi:mRNA interferase RelE/StbE